MEEIITKEGHNKRLKQGHYGGNYNNGRIEI